MRTSLLIGLLVTLCALVGVGTAAADSFVTYPDSSKSDAYNLGGGLHAFVFYDDAGDFDIFVHAVNFSANLLLVNLLGFNGYAFWLDFEGTSGPYDVYGVYSCTSTGGVFCTVSGVRRGTLLL